VVHLWEKFALIILECNDNKAVGRHDIPPLPASWHYLRIYSPGGTYSGMLAI